MLLRLLRGSIGPKIFAAFAAMALLVVALGAHSLYLLSEAGALVADTYDRPLMAINYSRSAAQTFMAMDKELLRRRIVAAAEQSAIDLHIEELSNNFFADLAIAEERSLAADERDVIREIRQLVEQWNEQRRHPSGAASGRALDTLGEQIINRFGRLVELTTSHGFVARREGIAEISRFETSNVVAALCAGLLAASIAALLARRIVRPLAAAADSADRIARGELTTAIPTGGNDEIGALLRSMAIMQENIRGMVERETAQRRSAQTRLIDALESSREGMMLVGADDRIVLANSQVARFFPPVAPFLVEGTDFASVLPLIRLHLAPESFAEGSESGDALDHGGELLLGDGRWLRVSRSVTRDSGFFLFLSDFTDVKEREERYRVATLRAEDANTAKDSFLANMSHELRTPLNAIIGFSEIIAAQMFGPVGTVKYVDYARDILQSARHLLDVINSVLDLAKSEAGKLQLVFEVVDLHEVLDDCLNIMREQCLRAGIAVEPMHREQTLLVIGEPAKLRQIFLNLLSNAVKFTESGGTISVHQRASFAGLVAIEIADTGIGMSQADIETALSPFEQVDSRLARRYQGTGLGLPLAKALTELHGGTIAIESTPGEGTRVTVSLRRANMEEEPRPYLRSIG